MKNSTTHVVNVNNSEIQYFTCSQRTRRGFNFLTLMCSRSMESPKYLGSAIIYDLGLYVEVVLGSSDKTWTRRSYFKGRSPFVVLRLSRSSRHDLDLHTAGLNINVTSGIAYTTRWSSVLQNPHQLASDRINRFLARIHCLLVNTSELVVIIRT